jgi:Domain of unknown function (DUF4390)
MTTTVFFLRFLKNAQTDLATLLVSAVFLIVSAFGAHAAPGDSVAVSSAEVSNIQVDRNPEGVFLTVAVRFELPLPVEEALLKGVPMFFVAEADIYRARWYWYDKKVVSAERHIRLAYQPLTRRWRINVASGAITTGSLGLALNQNFDTLPEAMSAIKRISRWKIAEAGEIDAEAKHGVDFRFRLDLSQLPRPFQIGVLGQADWNIFATATQQLNGPGAR